MPTKDIRTIKKIIDFMISDISDTFGKEVAALYRRDLEIILRIVERHEEVK